MEHLTTQTNDTPRLIDYGPAKASNGSRNISLKGRNNFRGQIVHKGQILKYESLLEHDAALVMLADTQVATLEDQPPAIRYIDSNTGFQRRHTFDFRATLNDDSQVAIAVKPKRKADKPEFQTLISDLKRDVNTDFADTVIQVTDADLSAARVADATLYLAANSISDPIADAAIKQAIKSINGTVSLATLTRMTGLGGRGFSAAIRALHQKLITITDRFAARPLSLARSRADGRIDQFTLISRQQELN